MGQKFFFNENAKRKATTVVVHQCKSRILCRRRHCIFVTQKPPTRCYSHAVRNVIMKFSCKFDWQSNIWTKKVFHCQSHGKVCNHEHWCWNRDQVSSRRRSTQAKFMENIIIFDFMLRDKIWKTPRSTGKVRKLPTLDNWRSAPFFERRKNYYPIKFWVPVTNFRLREITAERSWSHAAAVLQLHIAKILQRQCGDQSSLTWRQSIFEPINFHIHKFWTNDNICPIPLTTQSSVKRN